jgi:hypothetical protein
LIQSFEHEKAPPLSQETLISEDANPIRPGIFKRANAGSYARIDAWKSWSAKRELLGFRWVFRAQPCLTVCDHPQALISTLDVAGQSGIALLLGADGILAVAVGNGKAIDMYQSGIRLRRWRWSTIELSMVEAMLTLHVRPAVRLTEPAPRPAGYEVNISSPVALSSTQPLTLAAAFCTHDLKLSPSPSCCFNGGLDSVRSDTVERNAANFNLWAHYDFSVRIPTDTVFDKSVARRHGVLINAPTRAVKGHDWDRSKPDWTKVKYGYGAIHFHEDDLDDAAWETDFHLTVPEDAVSGAYTVLVKAVDRDAEDFITFFVRPKRRAADGSGPRAAMVLSTFTNLAYANEHMWDESRESHMELAGGVRIHKNHHWRRMARRTDLGLSLYDVHRDGSGTVFSTSKRPILNIRPGYIDWAFHRPRKFSADLFMIAFLERQLGKGGYDILTDHDMHIGGVETIAPYDVVITGCHPEYPSLRLFDAYTAYAKRGGSIMYLGGNGFYWTSEMDVERSHRLEVRKGDQGCRSVTLPAGERIHSLTGMQGGLWRSRGRPPQVLFGIGSCACGSGPGVPYKPTTLGTTSSAISWIWRGVTRDAAGNLPLIGIEGFGGDASGDEIDRFDYDLGTPTNAILVASSTGRDNSFAVFNEEIMFPMVNTLGTTCDKVRSDMVYYETDAGGAVFSVGSINWYCSLAWEDFNNDVATVTWNVLEEF